MISTRDLCETNDGFAKFNDSMPLGTQPSQEWALLVRVLGPKNMWNVICKNWKYKLIRKPSNPSVKANKHWRVIWWSRLQPTGCRDYCSWSDPSASGLNNHFLGYLSLKVGEGMSTFKWEIQWIHCDINRGLLLYTLLCIDNSPNTIVMY